MAPAEPWHTSLLDYALIGAACEVAELQEGKPPQREEALLHS